MNKRWTWRASAVLTGIDSLHLQFIYCLDIGKSLCGSAWQKKKTFIPSSKSMKKRFDQERTSLDPLRPNRGLDETWLWGMDTGLWWCPVGCGVVPPLTDLLWSIPLMLNWIEIWGLWRSGQHFELFFLFPLPFLGSSSSVAGCRGGTATMGWVTSTWVPGTEGFSAKHCVDREMID